MRIPKNLSCLVAGVLLAGMPGGGAGTAQASSSTPPSIKVTLIFRGGQFADRQLYLPADNVPFTLILENNGSGDVVTPVLFTSTPFHLKLTFVNQTTGQVITANLSDKVGDPPPPLGIMIGEDFVPVVPVQVLRGASAIPGPRWIERLDEINARKFYDLLPGVYSVKASFDMRTYPGVDGTDSVLGDYAYEFNPPLDYAQTNSNWNGTLESNTAYFSITDDKDGDGYYFPVAFGANAAPDCDDSHADVNSGRAEIPGNGIDDDCNPATPDMAPAARGTVAVQADLHTVGSGNYPGTTKTPLIRLPVKVVDASPTSCAAKYGMSWKNYYNIYEYCDAVDGGTGYTDTNGRLDLRVLPGTYFLVGAYKTGGGSNVIGSTLVVDDVVYIGGALDPVVANMTVQRYLQVIMKADKKVVPAKSMKLTGSELLIIEPEYIEWTGAQELYPFVFQSVGEWSIATSISPPKGFVADQKVLAADVNTQLKAVQFTVTDVGSDWVDTGVEYKIKHQGKTTTIKSKIGVKKSNK